MTDSRAEAEIYKINLAHVVVTKCKDVLKQQKVWSCHEDTGANVKDLPMANTEAR